MDKMHCRLIVIAAGSGTRFKQEGFEDPKPFIDVHGLRMLDLVVRNMRDQLQVDCPAHIITHASHGGVYFPIENSTFYTQDGPPIGAALTAASVIRELPDDAPIVICNCDQLVLFDGPALLNNLANKRHSLLTFEDPTRNPKWSYAEFWGDSKDVKRVAEKVAISTHATVGVYGYTSRQSALNAIAFMQAAKDTFNNEYYLCPAYNYVDRPIVAVESKKMWGLGTPEDLRIALSDPEFLREIERIR